MKKLRSTISILLACVLGYLTYPTVQATKEAIDNPNPEAVETYYLPCVMQEHFQAFGVNLFKVKNPKTGKLAWLLGRDLGLPPAGATVELRIDRVAVPFMNGQIYLNLARSDDLVVDRET